MTLNNSTPATFFLVTYNQSKFVEEAVRSALSQDYDNLEIIISDDASTDDTFQKVLSIVANYEGSHKVTLNQNKVNKGVNEHLNFVFFNLVKTRYVILQAGDDVSFQGRVKEIMKYFERNPDVYAVCSNSQMLNTNGASGSQFIKKSKGLNHKRSLPEVLLSGSGFYGASAAYHVDLFKKFGGLPKQVRNEDQILPLRASLLGRVGYVDKVLLGYRQHGNNLSFWSKKMEFGYRAFVMLEREDLRNRKLNLEYFLKDYNGHEYEIDCRREIVGKISHLLFKLYLLENSLFKRIVMLFTNFKSANKVFVLLVISPYIYFLVKKYMKNCRL